MKTSSTKKQINVKAKPITKTFSLIVTGQDQKGNEYDQKSCIEIIADLHAAGCFEKLTVYVSAAKKICFNDENAKGTITVARINGLDDDGNLEITFYGKNIELANTFNDNYVIVPRVRTERDSNKVVTITSFEIVPAMEA